MTSEAEVWIGPDAVKRGGLEVAEARIDGVPVQLIRISPDRSSPELVARFRQQARLLGTLRAANAERLLFEGDLDDAPFAALEPTSGQTLASLIASADPGARLGLVERFAQPIASALAQAHARGLFHGRIRPESILFARDGGVLLTGFLEGSQPLGDQSTVISSERFFLPRPAGLSEEAWDLRCLALVGWYALSGTVVSSAREIQGNSALGPLIAGVLDGAITSAEAFASALASRGGGAFVARTQTGVPPPLGTRTVPARVVGGSSSGPRTVVLRQPMIPEEEREPPETATLPELGSMVGSYEIVGEVGRGSNGVVFRANHVVLGRATALKVQLARVRDSETARRRFFREARALAALRHPGVVEIHDAGLTSDGAPFVAMELLEGEPLNKLGPMPARQAAELIKDVALGLAAIHEAGLIHRDIKPSNVMVERRAGGLRAKITDFGLVKDLLDDEHTKLTRAGWFLGTVAFCAPEQVSEPGSVGPAADLYALGATLYFALTGTPPHTGRGAEFLERRLSERAPRLTEHGAIGQVANQLLEFSPSARPASARATVELLERALVKDGFAPANAADEGGSLRSWIATGALGLAAISALAIWVLLVAEVREKPVPVAPEPSAQAPVTEAPRAEAPVVAARAATVAETPEPAPRASPPPRRTAPPASTAPRPTSAPSPKPTEVAPPPAPTKEAVVARARALGAQIRGLGPKVPVEALRPIETEYFAIKEALGGPVTLEALRDLDQRLQALEQSLARYR